EGLELASQLGDRSLHIWLLGEYAMTAQQAGAFDNGLLYAREGIRLADAEGDSAFRLMIRVAFIWLLLQSGRLTADVAASEEAETIAAGDADAGSDILGFSALGSVVMLRAAALTFLGQLVEARAALEQANAIGQQRNDREVLIWANLWAVN